MTQRPPILIVVFGLPGTGKTTFAKALAGRMGATHLFTDRIRSEQGRRGQYKESDKAWIYDELFRQTEEQLGEGRDVIVDGTFYQALLRKRLAELARASQVRIHWIQLEAAPETVRRRIAARREYSEADFEVYRAVREDFDPVEMPCLRLQSDGQTREEMLEQAINYLGR